MVSVEEGGRRAHCLILTAQSTFQPYRDTFGRAFLSWLLWK
jgi:hypothetical protein